MNNSRQQAIMNIARSQPRTVGVSYTEKPLEKVFGANVFSYERMREKLPRAVYSRMMKTLEEGERLDAEVANAVAHAMKEWALERGATHYTHWFQPMTGATAEKHDAFLRPTGGGKIIQEFNGKELIQGEPDASSFPTGGIRVTFEARGYTAWDPTSPAFLSEEPNGLTLVIPTAFCSYTGESLDKKTPLLRSNDALSKAAGRMLRLLGKPSAQRVIATVGPEQEYFLIDRELYSLRPDLITSGRTLFGARPPKGQQMEDHYFGKIRQRILAFMMDLEHEAYLLGIPLKTRHNEVSPAQFEVAPMFEQATLATDHNMLLMNLMQNIALRHGLQCILHEKPFAGVNGSGKHVNYAMSTGSGENLLEPGSTPHDNMQFIVFLTAVVAAVDEYADLLRLSVALAANDHRLGANEAPPAIMSIFLGDQLQKVVECLIDGKPIDPKKPESMKLGAAALPVFPRDMTDRNRTSPFAFTGNKFEFRAVGSSQNIAGPVIVLNTAVADTLERMAVAIEKEMKGDLAAAVQVVVKRELTAHARVLYIGDNYAKSWHDEAARRKLPNLRNTPDSLVTFISEKSLSLWERQHVFGRREVQARYNIMVENYIKVVAIEAQTTLELARTLILPSAVAHERKMAVGISATKSALGGIDVAPQEDGLRQVVSLINDLKRRTDELAKQFEASDSVHGDIIDHAKFLRDRVIPAMNQVRETADVLESVVEDSLWPMPKYREMLFVY